MKVDYPFSVLSYETDFRRWMKPAALQNRIQELAYLASEAGGASYSVLRSRGLFWALNRIHIQVDEWPLWGDELKLQTWLFERTGPLYQRQFILQRGNEVLMKATSSWTLLTIENRMICRELVYPAELMEPECVLPNCEKTLPPAGMAMEAAGCHDVVYSDLDSNKHVNNCIYLQWAMDLMGLDFLSAHRLTDIRTGYYREIHPGERVEFFLGTDGADRYVEGRIGEERSFCIQLTFRGAPARTRSVY